MVIQWPVPGIVWADYASLVYLATHLLLLVELSLSPCVDSVIVSCFRSGCGTDFKQDIVYLTGNSDMQFPISQAMENCVLK